VRMIYSNMSHLKTCIIIAGGEIQEEIEIFPDALILCADSGYVHALKQNIKPHVLIGDFDSYTDKLPEDIKIVRYPVEKDVSDTWACVEYAKEKGFDTFKIYGAFGGDRIDHSIANLQMLRNIAEENLTARFYYKKQIIRNLNAGEKITFFRHSIPYFSVFALSDVCKGVTIKGAKYPLENAELKNSFPLGLSNEGSEPHVEISVQEGNLLLVMTAK